MELFKNVIIKFYIKFYINIKHFVFLMHRGGIEPPAFGWKPKMLPLHQRCFLNDI